MATINEEGLGIVWDQVNQLVAQETSDLVTNSTLDITVRHINEDISSAVAAAGDNPTFTGHMSLNRAENSATGQKSVALGDANIASGTASMAEGLNSTASGNYAHAEGRGTTASGVSAHAEGTTSTASGDYSHAEGYGTTASGAYSHSEGNNSQSIGQYSHTEGYSTARSDYSHAEGDHTEVQTNSYAAHAEGYTTSARAYAAHAEGGQTIASGQYSHSEGIQTTASANGSHAEGGNTTASGAQSHAEGSGTTAGGGQAHAEGSGTTASGQYSHAEGVSATASGTGSHAEGGGTIAASNIQHVQGQYNIEDNQNTYLDIVGNGLSANTRSNAYTLDWSGNGVYAGKVTVGAAPTNNMDLTTKQYVDTAIAGISDARFYDIIECTVSQLDTSTSLPISWHTPSIKYNGTDILSPTATNLATLINNSNKQALLKINISSSISDPIIGGWYVPKKAIYLPLQSCHVGSSPVKVTFDIIGITAVSGDIFDLQFEIHDNIDSQGNITSTLSQSIYTLHTL